MTEPIIGACAKHGRNLASCPECSPNRPKFDPGKYGLPPIGKPVAFEFIDTLNPWECGGTLDVLRVEHLRAIGQLRVACELCDGSGTLTIRSGPFLEWQCPDCNGTGWKWSERR